MLGLHRNWSLHRSSSSSSSCCTSLHGHGCSSHTRTPSKFVLCNVFCGAGKRPSSASNPAAGNRSSKRKLSNSKQPKQQGSYNLYENAPTEQGSALAKSITSSITEVSDDSPTGLFELSDIVDEWGSSFDFIHTSAAFTKAAKLKHCRLSTGSSLLDSLADIWYGQLLEAQTRNMANVLWACGKLRYTHAQLWGSTLAAFCELLLQDNGQLVSCQELSNVMYGMASVSLSNKGDVPGVSRPTTEATVRQVVDAMCIRVTHPLLEGVSPQAISNSLWACAKLRINPGDAALTSLLQAMARPAMLEEAAPQAVANTLWAVSELRQFCSWQPGVQQRVWERLLGEQQLKRIATRGTSVDYSNALVALARLCSPTQAAVAPAVLVLEQGQLCAQQLLQGPVAQQVKKWPLQEITNSMWACAKLGVRDAAFVSAVSAAAQKLLSGAVAMNVKQLAYACKELQPDDVQLMKSIVRRSKQLLQDTGRRQLLSGTTPFGLAAAVGIAAAALDMQQLAGDVRALVVSSRKTAGSKLNRADAGMLWDVHSWLVQHQLLDGQGLAGLLSQQQLEQGRAAAAAFQAQQQQQ